MIPTPSARLLTEVIDGESTLIVRTYWASAPGFPPLDRPDGIGTCVKTFEIGNRLVRAINDGAAYKDASVAIDVNGKTYASANRRFMGKYLNSDLKKLGY